MTKQIGYKLNPKKLKGAPQIILPYVCGAFYYTEDYEYFDVIKPYLDIPEPRKSLEEIEQELDEKFDKLLVETKRKFTVSKETAEYHYNQKFQRIENNFEDLKKYGSFSIFTTGALDGSYLVSDGFGNPSFVQQSFVIKQGNKHEGYYSIGNGSYKFYMPKKPNFVFRYFVKNCLGLRWVDEK